MTNRKPENENMKSKERISQPEYDDIGESGADNLTNKNSSPELNHVSIEENKTKTRKNKKKKTKAKRSVFLLLSFFYIIVYFFYMAINASSDESFHAFLCLIAGAFGLLGYLFNSTTFSLIPLFVYSVSAIFNVKFVLYILPAILLNGIGYYTIYKEKERIRIEKEKEKQQKKQEETIRQAKELQGSNGNHPIVIIQNTNTNQNTNNIEQTYPYKSKSTAFFLALFFGMFGAHQAYVGRGGVAIVYCLTFGLFGIGWILDTIAILFGAFTDKWGRRLK